MVVVFFFFFSLARIFGEDLFIPRLRPFFFFFEWRAACAHRFHFSGQDQSTVVRRAKTTVAECSLTSCVWGRFPARFPHYAWPAQSVHSDFVGSRSSVICHVHFWHSCQFLLRATAVTRGGTDTEWESAHKVNSLEENSPAAAAGTRTRNFSITSPALYQ